MRNTNTQYAHVNTPVRNFRGFGSSSSVAKTVRFIGNQRVNYATKQKRYDYQKRNLLNINSYQDARK